MLSTKGGARDNRYHIFPIHLKTKSYIQIIPHSGFVARSTINPLKGWLLRHHVHTLRALKFEVRTRRQPFVAPTQCLPFTRNGFRAPPGKQKRKTGGKFEIRALFHCSTVPLPHRCLNLLARTSIPHFLIPAAATRYHWPLAAMAMAMGMGIHGYYKLYTIQAVGHTVSLFANTLLLFTTSFPLIIYPSRTQLHF